MSEPSLERIKLDNELVKEEDARHWKRERYGWIAVATLGAVAVTIIFLGTKFGLDKEWQTWARTTLTTFGSLAVGFASGKNIRRHRPGT